MKIFGVRNDEVMKEIMTHLMKRMILLNNNIVNMNRGSEWRQWDFLTSSLKKYVFYN